MRPSLLLILLTATVLLPLGAADTPASAPAPASPPAITWAPMIKRVAPCVVTVFSSRQVKEQNLMAPGMDQDPILRHFFGMGPGELEKHKEQGLGSGVVVRADGYILTNNHVVADADEIKVGFADSQDQYLAQVVGTDPKTDIAVLKIDPGRRTLSTIEFGDSTKSEVGDLVFAIGNPFGVGQTVTMGIISAVGRNININDYEDFIQTDASINPGNSGGALVDSNGKLIGINAAIISPTGSNLGIGFAVPVSMAGRVMTSIINHGKVVRGFLGVMIQPLDATLAHKLGLADDSGALVAEVEPDSPASKAGLRATDVIIGLNGSHVDDARHLRLAISQLPPGTTVKLDIERDGKPISATATLQDLGEAKTEVAQEEKPAPLAAPASLDRLGIQVQELNDEVRRAEHLPNGLAGVVISSVKPDSPAEQAELKPGMVILEIERTPVTSVAAAEAAIAHAPNELLLTLYLEGGRMYRAITLR